MEFHPVGAALIHVDRWTDRVGWTGMVKLIGSLSHHTKYVLERKCSTFSLSYGLQKQNTAMLAYSGNLPI
jgi:hypothetical protein